MGTGRENIFIEILENNIYREYTFLRIHIPCFSADLVWWGRRGPGLVGAVLTGQHRHSHSLGGNNVNKNMAVSSKSPKVKTKLCVMYMYVILTFQSSFLLEVTIVHMSPGELLSEAPPLWPRVAPTRWPWPGCRAPAPAGQRADRWSRYWPGAWPAMGTSLIKYV